MATLKKNEHYLFMGAQVTPLLLSDETNGELTVLQLTEVKGLEPPMHIHDREDEMWKVIDGEITFHFEDETVEAKAGDSIFVPKGKLHTFRLKTDTATSILTLTSTDFETIVTEFSRPASDANALPDSPPTMEQIQKLVEFGASHGLTIQLPQ